MNGQLNRYPYCPVPFGRDTFAKLADIMLARERGDFSEVILEFGSTRSLLDMGAGYATPFLAWLAKECGMGFGSIDNKKSVTDIANKICSDYFPEYTPATTSDAIVYMQEYNKLTNETKLPSSIALLYLDAYDYEGTESDKEFSKQKHLELFALCEPHLAPHALVMIDDVKDLNTWEGKGQLLIPELLKKGYKMLVKDYCCLLEKP